MFPQQSSFQDGAGGAAWFTWRNPDTGITQLWQTQWPTLVRKFQLKLKEILERGGKPYFSFTDQGVCYRGAAVDVFPASIIAEDIYQVANLTVDGQWSKQWGNALGLFLCATGQTDLAKQLGASRTAGTEVAAELVRQVIWIAHWVAPSDVYDGAGNPVATPAAVAKNGAGITLPANVILPKWTGTVTESALDAGWTGQSTWGDPVPVPPSLQAQLGAQKPWPPEVPVSPNGSVTTTTTTTPVQTQGATAKAVLAAIGVAITAYFAIKRNKRRR